MLPQDRFKKWKKNAVRFEQQRVIVERDVARSQTSQVPEFFHTDIQRSCGEIWIYEWHGAVGASEGTTFRYLENAHFSISAFPEGKSLGQRKPKRLQIQSLNDLIRAQRRCMCRA